MVEIGGCYDAFGVGPVLGQRALRLARTDTDARYEEETELRMEYDTVLIIARR